MPSRPRVILALLVAVFIAAFLLGRAVAPFEGGEMSTGTEEPTLETVPALRLPDPER